MSVGGKLVLSASAASADGDADVDLVDLVSDSESESKSDVVSGGETESPDRKKRRRAWVGEESRATLGRVTLTSASVSNAPLGELRPNGGSVGGVASVAPKPGEARPSLAQLVNVTQEFGVS